MAQDFIFTTRDLKRVHPPDKVVLEGISLSFYYGAKIGVIGANGAGKSSLLRIMAGDDDGYQGEARLSPNFTAGMLSQEPKLDSSKDVLGNVMDGAGEMAETLRRFEQVSEAMGEPDADFDALLDEQAKLQERIDAGEGWDLERKIEIAMDALRVPEGTADVTVLSGGEKRRVALCRLLLSEPDLLLLDEPTNHLDAESVAWLERFLAEYKGSVVAVTHDRYFLDNVAGWILELDRGRGIPFEGNYSSWLEQKSERLRMQEKRDESRRRVLERELDWVRSSPKARHDKSKARLKNYEKLYEEAQDDDFDRPTRKLQISIPPGPRLGDFVIEAEGVSKGFGERLLVDDLSFILPPAGIVGVIGANGAGKTTLLEMLAGNDKPDSGEIKSGPTVEIAYVEQARDSLDDSKSVYDEISGGHDILHVGDREMNSRAYVGSFNFKGSDQQRKVGDLSGGERNRLLLAKVLRQGANVILLDEPTNDLDVDTLRALEDGLVAFPGCVVVTSHDRWFIDRIATHVLAFEGDSQVVWFEGNFSDYETDRRARLGDEADQPHRIKYKPLAR